MARSGSYSRKQQDNIETDDLAMMYGVVERLDLNEDGSLKVGRNSGSPYLKITFVHRSRGYDKEEERAFQRKTYYDTTIFGQAASDALPYLREGTKIRVWGIPQLNTWTDKDGEKQIGSTIKVNSSMLDTAYLYEANGYYPSAADEVVAEDDLGL